VSVLASSSVRALVLLAAVCAALGAAGLAAPAARAETQGFAPDHIYQAPIDGAPTRGPADAPITVVLWSDFACKFCNRVEPTLDQLDQLYPGKLRWVFRHLPLDSDNVVAAEASLAAAAQGKFWPMKDRLFAVRGRVDRPAVELIAGDLGLDLVQFRGDLDAATYRGRVRADELAARTMGVTGTPTFFINGRPIRGAQPLASFIAVIDEELVRANAAIKSGIRGERLYPALVADGSPAADVPLESVGLDRVELEPTSVYTVALGLPDHQLGPDDALVTVVVFADFECGFCARNAPDLERLQREHPKDVRIVFRHMPLSSHRHAMLAAEAAVAAGAQGKFWAFHDKVFADRKVDRAGLEAAGQAVGLDMDAFRAALDDRRYHDTVAAEQAAANALGISGTPAMFVNGTPLAGAAGYDVIAALYDAHLAAASALVAHGVARRDVYGMVMLSGSTKERIDPSRIPRPGDGEVHIEMDAGDRETAAISACRDRDGARAGKLAQKLTGARRATVDATCSSIGIDLAKP
jgi:protein-disulfide isomerase